jgi:hypothetical protein
VAMANASAFSDIPKKVSGLVHLPYNGTLQSTFEKYIYYKTTPYKALLRSTFTVKRHLTKHF